MRESVSGKKASPSLQGTTEVPTYRILKGQLKGKNPFHGWQPVFFDDEKIENHFTNQPIGQPVAEMEHMLSRVVSGSGEMMIPLRDKQRLS